MDGWNGISCLNPACFAVLMTLSKPAKLPALMAGVFLDWASASEILMLPL